MVGWIVALFVIGFCIFVLLSKLYISFKYVYDHGSEVIQIEVQLYHIRLYQKNIDPEQSRKDWDSKRLQQHIQYTSKYLGKLMKHIHKRYRMLRKAIQYIHVHQFQWITEIGTGHASTTGVVSGGIWMAKGTLTGLLKNTLKQSIHPYIRVIPHYQETVLTSDAHCIVSMTVGKAIIVWLRIRHVLAKERHDRKEWFDG